MFEKWHKLCGAYLVLSHLSNHDISVSGGVLFCVDSESFPGLARHQVNVGRSRRVRQWPDDQQYLPGKKKKRLVEHKSPVLKEEPRGSLFGD